MTSKPKASPINVAIHHID